MGYSIDAAQLSMDGTPVHETSSTDQLEAVRGKDTGWVITEASQYVDPSHVAALTEDLVSNRLADLNSFDLDTASKETQPTGTLSATSRDSYFPPETKFHAKCSCMACLSVGIFLLRKGHRGSILCRFPCCVFSVSTWYATKEHVYHERDHFHLPGNPLFHYIEEHCKFTSKRFPDLIRHFQVRHCKSPQKVSCPLPW